MYLTNGMVQTETLFIAVYVSTHSNRECKSNASLWHALSLDNLVNITDIDDILADSGVNSYTYTNSTHTSMFIILPHNYLRQFCFPFLTLLSSFFVSSFLSRTHRIRSFQTFPMSALKSTCLLLPIYLKPSHLVWQFWSSHRCSILISHWSEMNSRKTSLRLTSKNFTTLLAVLLKRMWRRSVSAKLTYYIFCTSYCISFS